MTYKPVLNAALVKPAETLQPRHWDAHFEFFQTDRTFGVVDAVLLGCFVGKHAGASVW